jgi:hypothetical protein
MNPDPRHTPLRREYRLRVPLGLVSEGAAAATARDPEPEEVAPWVIAAVRAWPRTVEDRLVAFRMGIGVRQVRVARREQPAA